MKAIIAEYDRTFTSHSSDEVYFTLTKAARKFLVHCNTHDTGWGNLCNVPHAELESILRVRIDDQFETEENENEAQCPPNRPWTTRELRLASSFILSKIRRRVLDATGGLSCSAGLANNYMLAKIAGGPHVVEIFHDVLFMKVNKFGCLPSILLSGH